MRHTINERDVSPEIAAEELRGLAPYPGRHPSRKQQHELGRPLDAGHRGLSLPLALKAEVTQNLGDFGEAILEVPDVLRRVVCILASHYAGQIDRRYSRRGLVRNPAPSDAGWRLPRESGQLAPNVIHCCALGCWAIADSSHYAAAVGSVRTVAGASTPRYDQPTRSRGAQGEPPRSPGQQQAKQTYVLSLFAWYVRCDLGPGAGGARGCQVYVAQPQGNLSTTGYDPPEARAWRREV